MKKIILYTITAFLGLSAIIIIYTGFVFDPDDYREEITEYISDKINYDFSYEGSIEISYQPKSSISISDIIISEQIGNKIKTIVELERAELLISNENLLNKIIDVEKIQADNLKYFGVNIDEILMKTYSLSKFKFKDFVAIDEKNYTNIYTMSSTAIIKDNYMYINNIYIESELLKANGTGKINLLSKEVNFNLNGELKRDADVYGNYKNHYPVELYEHNLPIKISGLIENLSVSIDLSKVIFEEVIAPIKNKIFDKIKNKVIDDLKETIKLPQ
jgi:hypothetical protein|tara:strand:+ start:9469 stop:10290 length:822 start_codon:yes stop_codon:yes gene_type:complete